MTERTSNTGDQGGGQLFKDVDETERIYSPETVPGTRMPAHEVDADPLAGGQSFRNNEIPAAGPVATIASNPTGSAAVPNIGDNNDQGAPGDPETQADYPIGDDQNMHHGEPRTT